VIEATLIAFADACTWINDSVFNVFQIAIWNSPAQWAGRVLTTLLGLGCM